MSEEDKEKLLGYLNDINRKLDENINSLKENTDKLGDRAINNELLLYDSTFTA